MPLALITGGASLIGEGIACCLVEDGWEALTLHYPGDDFESERWYLFNLDEDPSEARDLADLHPDRVEKLRARWDEEAWQNQVFPLAEGMQLFTLMDPSIPEPGPLKLYASSPTAPSAAASRITSFRAFEVTALLEHRDGDRGVIAGHGDQGGGYTLYVGDDDGLWYVQNTYGQMVRVNCGAMPSGDVRIRLSISPRSLSEWDVAVFVGDEERASETAGALGMLAPLQGIDVGRIRRSPVDWELRSKFGSYPYAGTVKSLTYVPGESLFSAAKRRQHEIASEMKVQ